MKRQLPAKKLGLVAFAAAFAIIGVILTIQSFAATSTYSVEAESGTVATPATIVNDLGASGGAAVQFKASTPNPQPSTDGLKPYSLGLAPYLYLPWQGSLSNVQAGVNNRHVIAAFITTNGSCNPAWDGEPELGLNSARGNEIAADIATLRGRGGDVMISFGGAAGTEPGVSCTTFDSLKQAYKSVIDRYDVDKIDFDIEGPALPNAAANSRRADVIKSLQQEKPDLKIWVTLPVMQNGMDGVSVGLIKQLYDKGVLISGVNIMVMDYGTNEGQMGQAAIRAANSTFNQLKQIYTKATDDRIWKVIALTPMIGINDTRPETFTLANAAEMRNFAQQKGIGMIGYWGAHRDKACPGNAADLSESCSGVAQTQWQFGKTMLYTPPAN